MTGAVVTLGALQVDEGTTDADSHKKLEKARNLILPWSL